MAFKRKSVDKERGFVNYFWKAVPVPGAIEEGTGIRFDDRVAIVTGAGAGLGRAYTPWSWPGAGPKSWLTIWAVSAGRVWQRVDKVPADKVVEEIKKSGGEALANYDNVATRRGGENIVKTALDAYGRVDILINNAGILRDKSFLKMEPKKLEGCFRRAPQRSLLCYASGHFRHEG